jgi:2-polyprenyl-6-methoxyphenol hydroxylase-like FAD-dependent oxidoreductase
VRIEDRTTREVVDFAADLVIDATGRGSKSPQWLRALGYDAPAETVVGVNLAYATRHYHRDPADLSHIIVAEAPPHGSRGCAMLAQEGDRFILTLFGYAGDHPPTDDAGFLEFARSLPTPAVYERIKNAQPLSDVAVHKFPSNLRRHYEKLSRMPERYLVIGDAVCSFNPIYGQGMSVSAMEAEALQQVLARTAGLDGLRKSFYAAAIPAVDVPWTLASGADLAYARVQGARNPMANLINAYVAQLHVAASIDQQVALTFFEVANLVRPPSALFAPALVLRTLRAARRAEQRTRADATVPASTVAEMA